MPLVYKKQLKPEGLIGIWKIEEDEAFFLKQLSLFPKELLQLEMIKGFRRVEWLASRHLLHVLSDRNTRGAVIKDNYGKPYLEQSKWHVSMSHSNRLAAVIASPLLVGVDIQKIVPRITHIAHRWLHQSELDLIHNSDNPIEVAHVLWGAKESLFKAYGKGQLDFTRDLRVEPFEYNPEGGHFVCNISNQNKNDKFSGTYELIEDNVFVHIVEIVFNN